MFSFVVREVQLTFICDFRAMPSLVPPCVVPWSENHPSVPPCPVPGLGTTLLLSFCCPSHTLFCGPRDPMFSLVVRAAAANVNPRTRLSHLTPFSGRDWCTRERCRLMMQNSSQDFAASSGFSQNFPRIFRESQTTPRARPHPQPHTSAEAWCVLH